MKVATITRGKVEIGGAARIFLNTCSEDLLYNSVSSYMYTICSVPSWLGLRLGLSGVTPGWETCILALSSFHQSSARVVEVTKSPSPPLK
jgi:hypothetical protein